MRFGICCTKDYFWRAWERPGFGDWFYFKHLPELTPDGVIANILTKSYLTSGEPVDPTVSYEPDILFFTHWSRKVPASIHERWTCINFHCTPLPYGRGSSPVQNMILAGLDETMVTAHKMVEEMDAGPIYAQQPVSLLGSADEVYRRLALTMSDMIVRLAEHLPEPREQTGEVVTFPRRRPEQSVLPGADDLYDTFRFIQMLDAEGYPHAFIPHGNKRIEFTSAVLRPDHIEARVRIRNAD